MNAFARWALSCVLALQVASLAYVLASLVLDPLNVFTLWAALATLLTVVLLAQQRALLRELFARRPVPEEDLRLGRFRALFPWTLGMGAAQLVLLGLVLLGTPVSEDTPNPVASLLFLVAGFASLYASLGTFTSLARAFVAPQGPGVRAALHEWLARNLIAGGVFYVMNLATTFQTEDAWSWPRLVPSALYVLTGVFDLALVLFTRLALARDAVPLKKS